MEAFEGIGAALTMARIVQLIAMPIAKNITERLPQKKRNQMMAVVEKLQSDAEDILSSISNLQESRIKTAYLCIKLAMKELRMCCKHWNQGYESLALTLGSPLPWDTLEKSEEYKNAMRHYKKAEEEAMAILHDGKNVRSHLRVEAMHILLFCQVVLHWKKPEEWFHLWTTIFENSLFDDRDLVRATLLRPGLLKYTVSVEDKVARIRMEQLVNEMAEAVVRTVCKDGSRASYGTAVKALLFVKRFNHSVTQLPDLRKADDWTLLGPAEASFSGVLWFACAWGKLGLLPSGEQFMTFQNCKDPTFIGPNALYAVNPAGELLKLNAEPPIRKPVVTSGSWKILGYANEQGALYVISDSQLKTICASLKPDCARPAPEPPEGRLEDYVFLVASNGSLLAYNKAIKKRFVRFASIQHGSLWAEVEDTGRTDFQTMVNAENQLLVDGPNESNRLVRLSLTCSGGRNVYIQAEKLKWSLGNKVVSKFSFHEVNIHLHGAALVTDFSRLPINGPKSGRVYAVGYADDSTMCFMKLRLIADRGRITKKSRFEMETQCHTELYPKVDINRITYGNGTIFL